MTTTETTAILRQLNEWRRLEDDALIYSDSEIAEMGRQEPVAEWLPLDSGEDTRRD